jgi:hypothetical protein
VGASWLGQAVGCGVSRAGLCDGYIAVTRVRGLNPSSLIVIGHFPAAQPTPGPRQHRYSCMLLVLRHGGCRSKLSQLVNSRWWNSAPQPVKFAEAEGQS